SPATSPPTRSSSSAPSRSRSPAPRPCSATSAGPRRSAGRSGRAEERKYVMCGIVGIIGRNDVTPLLVEGLRRLEYRGYDSAGVATLVDGKIERRRAPGKLDRLAARLHEVPLPGKTGIGHTRWAAHGIPSEGNAHPHAT